jgi:hypothetical protein
MQTERKICGEDSSMKKRFRHCKVPGVLPALLASGAAGVLTLAPAGAQAEKPANIALGKTVTFGSNPNYALSTDPEDRLQLTDGKRSTEGEQREIQNTRSIWVQKGTVGWSNTFPTITIDLGSEQAISGVSYSTAAGRAGVLWPRAIYVAVSNDNKTFHAVGDLVELSRKNGQPPEDGYSTHTYTTHDLKTHGRYVALAIVSSPYTFVDEVEVYAGNPAWLQTPLSGATFTSITNYLDQSIAATSLRNRLQNDADAVREAIQNSKVPAPRKNELNTRLNAQIAKIGDMSAVPENFKAIVPLNDTHRGILAVHGDLLAAQNVKPLTVWKQHRFAYLPLIEKPGTQAKTQLDFSMLGNQVRSDSLLLTNAGSTPQTVQLKIANPPRGAQDGWLKMDSVEWTDTKEGNVVPDVLTPLEMRNGSATVSIPAGLTRKIWLTVDSSKLPAGETGSTLEISGAGASERVPMNFDISPIAMQTPRISLGMWDYTDRNAYGLSAENQKAAIALMRSHFVDTPWATSAVLPRPKADDFDANNNLKNEMDFSGLDDWIALWPGARRYFVFASVGESALGGAKRGTPEFAPRVGSWAKALSSHMTQLGLKPQQLGILLVDEPHSDEQDEIIAEWAKAINAAAPELTLFQDPTWDRPDQAKVQEAITEIDVICPNLPIYYRGGAPVKDYFADLKKQGKELWFYQCSGPVRPYDPQLYYRYQPWHTFAIGGTGQGFWAFGDTGKAISSWNEYSAGGTSYAPAFLSENEVRNSIHWDAVREGMQDYEELAMLQDAINDSKNAALKAQAQQVLDSAVQAITATYVPENQFSWKAQKFDPNLGDAQLKKVRAMLEKLRA